MMIEQQTIAQLKLSEHPVVVANNEGLIIDINAPFEAVFGWKIEEIQGESLTIILPPFFRDSHNLGFARFTATGESHVLNHPLVLKAVTKDNTEIESEHFIIAEKQNDVWFFAAIVKPL